MRTTIKIFNPARFDLDSYYQVLFLLFPRLRDIERTKKERREGEREIGGARRRLGENKEKEPLGGEKRNQEKREGGRGWGRIKKGGAGGRKGSR